MTRYPSVTGLVRQVVKEAHNGVPPKAVAHILGMEYGTFMAQLGRRSNHKLDADLLLPLMEITDSYAPLHLLAEAMGGFFVPMPDVMHPGHTVQRQCMASVKKFGDLMQRVAGALEDGTIDEDERREIVRCGYEAQTAILALLRVPKIKASDPMQRIEGPNSQRSYAMMERPYARAPRAVNTYLVRLGGEARRIRCTHQDLIAWLRLMMTSRNGRKEEVPAV